MSTEVDPQTVEAIRARWDDLHARRKLLADEDEAMLTPHATNGRVRFTVEVMAALGPRFVELEKAIATIDDEIEAFKANEFSTLLALSADLSTLRAEHDEREAAYVALREDFLNVRAERDAARARATWQPTNEIIRAICALARQREVCREQGGKVAFVSGMDAAREYIIEQQHMAPAAEEG